MNMQKIQDMGYIPKILFKFYLRLKERFDPTPQPNEEELFCVEICKKLIPSQESKLTNAPLSHKRYIKNDEKDMFVVIYDRSISLINHIYSYNVFIENDKLYGEILQMFDNELEKRRLELENEIKSNIKHSLRSILNKVSQDSLSTPS
jgi:hypothetical protein